MQKLRQHRDRRAMCVNPPTDIKIPARALGRESPQARQHQLGDKPEPRILETLKIWAERREDIKADHRSECIVL